MIHLFTALLLALLVADPAMAQGFGPKNYPECTMLYAKKAVARDGAMLAKRACKCRYQDPAAPECKEYSQAALDCIITNVGPVERDEQVWGVDRACRNKHPVK